MPSCIQEMLSALFIGLTGKYRLTYEDKAMEAEEQLDRLMVQLDKREEGLRCTVHRAAEEAVRLKGKDKARCKLKLQEYKRAQAQLDRLVAYKDMVYVHMDALRNTELNKTLIAALQESTKTLKSMGIEDGVKHAEAVVTDVENSMAQAQELTAALNFNSTFTDAELDAELHALLEEDPVPEDRLEEEVTAGPKAAAPEPLPQPTASRA
jgi:uncharacterized protein YicC (UPF0701 family)